MATDLVPHKTMRHKINKRKYNRPIKINKPWFTIACKERQKQYRYRKNIFKKDKSLENLHHLKQSCNLYKKELSKSKFKWHAQFCSLLRGMKRKNRRNIGLC